MVLSVLTKSSSGTVKRVMIEKNNKKVAKYNLTFDSNRLRFRFWSRVNLHYPFDTLSTQIPASLHSDIRQSIYFQLVEEEAAITVDPNKSSEENEHAAWDTLAIVIHGATFSTALPKIS
jgi:hypothetical protein